MLFRKKKYETYGEGGLYEGVKTASTSKINCRKGCRIHISQDKNQKLKIEIINNGKITKQLCVEGDKWIRINGSGEYWVRAFNNATNELKAGLSIRSID
ncbi:hypothetical protein J2Z60_001214 [Lactobacillus colini]|uniref:Uncharacterized protein n=1 Tax=Lactobacillus colini TaxID=1819254 RepID=A0ABS4MF96_9LACO|nr:hypothetical protein [Lactobacillus colini]MBP2058037.1 hypothetical protein [Lactobacillus colini]